MVYISSLLRVIKKMRSLFWNFTWKQVWWPVFFWRVCMCRFILPHFFFASPRPSSPPCTSQASFLLLYFHLPFLFLISEVGDFWQESVKKKIRGTHFTNLSLSLSLSPSLYYHTSGSYCHSTTHRSLHLGVFWTYNILLVYCTFFSSSLS